MNIFMNFVKRSLAGRGIRGRVGALGEVGALLLLALDLLGVLASSFSSPEMLARGLTQGLCWVVRDPRAIAKV